LIHEKEHFSEQIKQIRSQFAGFIAEIPNSDKMKKLKEKLSSLGASDALLK